MRTTISLDEGLVNEAKGITGIDKLSPLLTRSLELLVAQHGAQRLAALGGSDPAALGAPRNR